MIRRLFAAFFVLAALFGTACDRPGEGPPPAEDNRGSDRLKAKDAKTLTLQTGDLPAEWTASEAGLIEITPNNLDDMRARGELQQEDYDLLKQISFASIATRTFTVRGDGAVRSTVAIFDDVEAARRWFARPARGQRIEDAPKYGDESFSERTEVDTDPSDDRNIIQAAIHTVIRVDNVVIEVSDVDDPSQIDSTDSLELASEALEKLE